MGNLKHLKAEKTEIVIKKGTRSVVHSVNF
jgi:hypothetical protein